MTARQIPPFGVRMPDDLKAWVIGEARKEGRSMNNLIVQTLREKMMATGAEPASIPPAAENDEAAQQGGSL